MAELRHENICQVYGLNVIDGVAVQLVLEYVSGGDLKNLLRSSVPLPWPTRMKFIHQACIAVNYIHARRPSIIHRDIKAENFLVKNGTHLLLSDFRIAKFKDNVGNTSTGTRNWSTPEILQASPQWGEAADIYSLGMTIWEIAARKIPFEGVDVFALQELVHSGQRPQIPNDCPQVR